MSSIWLIEKCYLRHDTTREGDMVLDSYPLTALGIHIERRSRRHRLESGDPQPYIPSLHGYDQLVSLYQLEMVCSLPEGNWDFVSACSLAIAASKPWRWPSTVVGLGNAGNAEKIAAISGSRVGNLSIKLIVRSPEVRRLTGMMILKALCTYEYLNVGQVASTKGKIEMRISVV